MYASRRQAASLIGTLTLATIVILGLGLPAGANPKLQLYVPYADSYSGPSEDPWLDESWVVKTSAFQIWVVADSDSPISPVSLTIAVPTLDDGTPGNGSVHLNWAEGDVPNAYGAYMTPLPPALPPSPLPPRYLMPSDDGDPAVTFSASGWDGDFYHDTPTYGDPPKDLGTGIYPTWYVEVDLGPMDPVPDPDAETLVNLAGDALEPVWDTQNLCPEEDSSVSYNGTGLIYRFDVMVDGGFDLVNFDAHNCVFVSQKVSKGLFAPYSHNALHTPEPASIAFFGVTFAGIIAHRVRRKKRRQS